AQPDLEEPVAADGTRLDQPAHRLAVAVQVAEGDVAGVGVGVEVDHGDPAQAAGRGDAAGVGQRHGGVAAEGDRGRPGGGDTPYGLLDVRDRPLDVAGVAPDAARVEDPQVTQGVHAQREARPGAVVRQVARLPDRAGPEAGAGAVAGPA